MIKVYFCYFSSPLNDNIFNEYLLKIPLKLQQKTIKFKRWQDKHNFLFGKILLQKALREFNYTLNDVKISKYKRPYINGIDFNISHSQNLVICAISNNNLGIDIEAIKGIDLNDFRDFFENEWEEIKGSKNPLNKFYEYWTIKEAILKAYGSGFLKNLDMKIDKNRVVFNDKTYFIKKLNIKEDYICHLSSIKNEEVKIEEVKF